MPAHRFLQKRALLVVPLEHLLPRRRRRRRRRRRLPWGLGGGVRVGQSEELTLTYTHTHTHTHTHTAGGGGVRVGQPEDAQIRLEPRGARGRAVRRRSGLAGAGPGLAMIRLCPRWWATRGLQGRKRRGTGRVGFFMPCGRAGPGNAGAARGVRSGLWWNACGWRLSERTRPLSLRRSLRACGRGAGPMIGRGGWEGIWIGVRARTCICAAVQKKFVWTDWGGVVGVPRPRVSSSSCAWTQRPSARLRDPGDLEGCVYLEGFACISRGFSVNFERVLSIMMNDYSHSASVESGAPVPRRWCSRHELLPVTRSRPTVAAAPTRRPGGRRRRTKSGFRSAPSLPSRADMVSESLVGLHQHIRDPAAARCRGRRGGPPGPVT
jgi:hypothetical protein